MFFILRGNCQLEYAVFVRKSDVVQAYSQPPDSPIWCAIWPERRGNPILIRLAVHTARAVFGAISTVPETVPEPEN